MQFDRQRIIASKSAVWRRSMPQWIRVDTIAKELDVSEATVRNWIREGKLKAAKFGRDYRIRKEDYEEFIQKHLNPNSEQK
jgi:excisionase family DNA binding protein